MKDRILCKIKFEFLSYTTSCWREQFRNNFFRCTIRHDRSYTFLYSFIAADHWRLYLQISSFLYQSPHGLITMFLAAYVAPSPVNSDSFCSFGAPQESRSSTQHYWRTKVYIIHGETANCYGEIERSSRGNVESSLIFNRSFRC